MAVHLKRDGLYAGIDQISGVAYADRTAAGPWEEAVITPHEQWSDIKFGALQFCVNQQTRQLESRLAGDIDRWGGQWEIRQINGVWSAQCSVHIFALENYAAVKLVHLEQRGIDFVDEYGKRTVLPGIDMFPALRFYLDGGPAALQPFFDESARVGMKVWRVWSQGSRAQNNFLDLSPKEAGYYDRIGPFIDACNKGGIVPLLTCFVDNQDVKSPVSHWSELTARGKGKPVLWSGGNQYPKNGFDPWALPNPGSGFIWSRGSSTDDEMTNPKGAPAGELHATRQSFDRALMDATASPPTMRKPENGYGMCWMTEGNPFGDDKGYNEFQAWCLGRGYSILWALAIFHNRQSQFGKLMTDKTAREAAAWSKGMTL